LADLVAGFLYLFLVILHSMSIENLEELIANADTEALDDFACRNPELAKAKTSLNVSPLMLSCYYHKPAVTSVLLKHTTDLSLFEAAAADRFDDVAYHYCYPSRKNRLLCRGRLYRPWPGQLFWQF
jgi:hypothetical protein